MLRESLYTIGILQADGENVSARVTFNPQHEIFKGHFPGQPVVPGACMVQILKDALHTAYPQRVRLTKGGDIKFLAAVDPNNNPVVQLQLHVISRENDRLDVAATLSIGELKCFKFTGSFASIS